RDHDADRLNLVHRGVGGVEQARGGIEAHVARDDPAKLALEVRHARIISGGGSAGRRAGYSRAGFCRGAGRRWARPHSVGGMTLAIATIASSVLVRTAWSNA